MSPVRVLVADDHEVVRQGVRALLQAEPGFWVCGEARDGREAVEKARQLKPDIVILDIGMPELNGLEAARQILSELPRTEVLILTLHESEQLVREVLAAGARGYVLKSDAGRDLLVAVNALRRHKPFFTSRVSEIVLKDLRRPCGGPSHASHPSLTPREHQILILLAGGKCSREVAAALGIRLKTVETHRANLMRKLGLHSIGDLVRYAIRNRLIEP